MHEYCNTHAYMRAHSHMRACAHTHTHKNASNHLYAVLSRFGYQHRTTKASHYNIGHGTELAGFFQQTGYTVNYTTKLQMFPQNEIFTNQNRPCLYSLSEKWEGGTNKQKTTSPFSLLSIYIYPFYIFVCLSVRPSVRPCACVCVCVRGIHMYVRGERV